MIEPLFLVHIPVALSELARLAHDRNHGAVRRRRKDGREREVGFDEGRALHHLLDETFGPATLRPFRLMVAPRQTGGSIYAYTRVPESELLSTARETGPPEATRVLALDRLASKEMPQGWKADRRLAFDIRIRPVVRLMKPLPDPRQPDRPYKPGAELDAYFVEAQRSHPEERPEIVDGRPVPSGMASKQRTRQAVYRDWLHARLNGAAEIDPGRTVMRNFRRTRAARTGHAPEGPDAILHGELVIKDATRFAGVLAHGVGRHKAYGYGMLLLRPCRRPERET